ncbi:uncharacterized protein LOC125473356 [Pyrus x bretschneideri]|uniref:uncharacterized protein LOC125473356 n=1 Tax=Pyrus x bretschneideri TaxID=225117 RepID=UPI00202DDD6E|nr:uncharacterized protein LOC125473356 [Pyrus x bretschneideri]
MAPTPSLAGLQIETTAFPPSVKPPGSSNTLFLGDAGVRGLEIQGNFVKITAIGVYLEDNAVPQLAVKWKGKTAEELTESVEFFRDIVTGPFEKFIQVTTILPLTGQQYAEKVSEIKRAEETEDLDKVEEIPSSFPFKIEDTPEDSEDQIAYEGPDFHDLDENLQKAFHKYLEVVEQDLLWEDHGSNLRDPGSWVGLRRRRLPSAVATPTRACSSERLGFSDSAAANALFHIATDQERVRIIIDLLGINVVVSALGDSPMKVQVCMVRLVSEMAELDPVAQEEYDRAASSANLKIRFDQVHVEE